MVEPSSPILSPASPTNSTSSSSSSQSESSNASSSSSVASASSRGSGGSGVVAAVTPKVERVNSVVVNVTDNDEVIELSSDSEGEQRSRSGSLSPVSCSSSEPPEDDLEMIEEMRQMQKQFQLKLDKLEKRVNKRRRLKQERESLANQPEPISVPGPVQNSEPVPTTSRGTTVETKKGLKRKLEIVTEELSRSRMEHAKKQRKNNPRERMVIDIPDFPMEYYDKSANYALYYEGTSNWFDHFNKNPEVNKFGDYYNWITERTNNLLPEVLKILQNTQKRNAPASDELKNADLLACRPVCKSWKQSLDKYLQGQVSNQDNLDFWNGRRTSVATKISNKRLDKFAQLISTISRAPLENQHHPFPSRQLRLEVHPVYSVESSQYFQTGMDSFLNRFGHEVSYLSFISYQETAWFFVMIHALGLNWFTLRKWLLKMPNLRGVNFQFSPTVEAKTQEREEHETVILASEPFPPLAKLEFIDCHFVPSDIVDSMLSNNPQIKKLAVYETYNKKILPWPWSDFQLNFLQNLSHLSVNVYEMTQLDALRLVRFPLRNLQLSSIGPMVEKWNLDKVFGILRNFGNTLKQLRLKLRISIPDKDLKLALPNLEELDLCFQQNSADQTCYDFILPLSSLQCLNVNFNWEIEANGSMNGNGVTHGNGHNTSTDENNENVEVIQLKSYQNRLYSSNIWNLFPCLKHVIIEDREREESPARTYKYCRDRLPK